MTRAEHLKLAQEIHQDNIAAGWWKQEAIPVQVGEDPEYETVPRNIGELLCLVHSEIDEAWHGLCGDLYDDHLHHYKMIEVELADTAIRAYDIIGYYNSTAQFQETDYLVWPFELMPDNSVIICMLHSLVSQSMEGFRKSNNLLGVMKLWNLLDTLYQFAEKLGFPLAPVIEAKREYNRNRADHKPENRAKADGKVF